MGILKQQLPRTLSTDTEATIARDTFEGMLETLSRKKKSISRASHQAIDYAKYSLVGEVSLISVIFQYGKQAAHFIFAYYWKINDEN